MTWFNGVLPVITAGVGFMASYLGDWGRDRRAERNENARRSAARVDEHDKFEIGVLTSCSEHLSTTTNAALKIYVEQVRFRVDNPDADHGDAKISDDLQGEYARGRRELERLTGLILSASVRASVEAATEAIREVRSFRGNSRSAFEAYRSAEGLAKDAQAALATRIRALYGGDRP